MNSDNNTIEELYDWIAHYENEIAILEAKIALIKSKPIR